jgi:TonB family protein
MMIAYYVALAAAMTSNHALSSGAAFYLDRIKPPVTVAPPPPRTGSNPVPTGNPGLWVTTNDYPSAALREEREGLVAFRLTVGPDGMVKDCQITASSGSTDLDTTACLLISQRARFTPARNAKGKPDIGYYANRVRWQIPSKGQFVPSNLPIPKEGQITHSFTVDENGKVSDCKMSGSLAAENGKTPCDVGVTFQPYYNNKGERVKIRIVTSQVVNIVEAGEKGSKTE